MKLISKLLLASVLMMSLAGCSKYLDKLDDPNLVTDPPLNGMLVTATYESALDVYRVGYETSYLVQYLSSNVQGSDRDIYNEVDYSSRWTAIYAAMMNVRQMNDKAAAEGAYHHLGVGKILMAMNLNLLINTFGDVPYSEALMGQSLLIPTFDNQAALFDTTIALLDQGITELNKTGTSLVLDATSDLIHGGDVAAWIKTAHGLKARFLNQRTKKADYSAAAVLGELASSYTSGSDDAALTAFDGRSPWNEVANDNINLLLDGWLSTQFVDALDGTTFGVVDPRLPKIATITRFGDYRGTPNGAGRVGTGTNQEESYLSVDGFYSKGNAPLWLVTYTELKFIEAEAALRSSDRPRAYTAYIEGIRSHMEKLGVAAGDITNYINNPTVNVGQANLTLADIFKEKYVAMFLHPEAWVDARRFDYGYKDFTLPQNAAMNTFIRRFAYPTVEISRNSANVPTIDGLDEKLAFDSN